MDTSNSWQRALAAVNPSARLSEGRDEVLSGRPADAAKRALDIVLAMSGLVLLMPLMLGIAVILRLQSRRPVLFVSSRLGRNGRVFRCLKFRSMTDKGQVTRIGSFLRRYGLDELPQLANVLRGQMSVVGPRPVMASDSPGQHLGRFRRFDVNPGMTGLWAMHQADWAHVGPYISPDESYRRNWSVWLDLMIVMRSVGAAVAGGGH
jgi:lipopolysaccharide/colanic/teichoic acid biosynthesis glycosyltransferase